MRETIDREKAEAIATRDHPDWPWTNFISSLATYRGSANWTKKVKPRMAKFAWNRVTGLPDAERKELFYSVPNPIYRRKVTIWLESIYQNILAEGGPAKLRERLGRLRSSEEWLAALQSYKGIGPKYARNIGMDVYHPLLREHFALDSRLFQILAELVHAVPTYVEGEEILKALAAHLGIDTWSLDRILYGQYVSILKDLRQYNQAHPFSMAPSEQKND